MTEMQRQFEEWLNGEFDAVAVKSLTTEGLPVYASLVVQRMWDAWQASRAAVVVKLPKPEFRGWVSHETIEGYKAAIDEVKYALDDAEVNYE